MITRERLLELQSYCTPTEEMWAVLEAALRSVDAEAVREACARVCGNMSGRQFNLISTEATEDAKHRRGAKSAALMEAAAAIRALDLSTINDAPGAGPVSSTEDSGPKGNAGIQHLGASPPPAQNNSERVTAALVQTGQIVEVESPPAQSAEPERYAAWVDGVCKTCGNDDRSCKCKHRPSPLIAELFGKQPEPSAGETPRTPLLVMMLADMRKRLEAALDEIARMMERAEQADQQLRQAREENAGLRMALQRRGKSTLPEIMELREELAAARACIREAENGIKEDRFDWYGEWLSEHAAPIEAARGGK